MSFLSILIIYNRFLCFLKQLESVHWLFDGQQFMSAHNDGSYILWKTSDNLHPAEQPKTPYGPFPCKAINKIIWKTVENRFV